MFGSKDVLAAQWIRVPRRKEGCPFKSGQAHFTIQECHYSRNSNYSSGCFDCADCLDFMDLFMKIAYFDCYYGVTPRKLLSAIIDAGVKADILIEEIRKLKIPFGIDIKKEKRGQNKATNIELKTEENKCPTTLNKIINLINLFTQYFNKVLDHGINNVFG